MLAISVLKSYPEDPKIEVHIMLISLQYPDSESIRSPNSCIVGIQWSLVDLGEVCVVQSVSMIICEVFWVHKDGLTYIICL